MTAPLEPWWTASEIYAALGVSEDTLRKLAREHLIGYVKVGRSRRYTAEHVAQIRAALEVKPAPTHPLAAIGTTPNGIARRRRRTSA